MNELRTMAGRLLETSPEIEQRPLHRRPRFMAAAWGGLVVCKLTCVVTLGPAVGLPLLTLTLFGGAAAVHARFGSRPRALARAARSG